ncbi:hypothetical protein Acr_12g0000800 [Actinidia rufa]|uniref:Uncharacterized protein n=1 Tax=Actinidia rufa TaxID=165716 RepID=A0A7J0FHA5_9ERIC|nr:hypothetical protein Acr_12g0000800 [Actinidia rufa]
MELNQAQMLYNDAALKIFRANHSIPDDTNAEGSDGALPPHFHASVSEFRPDNACGGHTNVPTGDSLYCLGYVARVHCAATEERARHPLAQRLILIHTLVDVTNFNELFKKRSEKCKAAIQNLNNRQVSKKVADLLAYELIYYHIIPHQTEDLGRVRHLALCIEGSSPLGQAFSSKGFNTKLDESAMLARDPDLSEGNTSSLSNFVKFDSLDS